ncbi:MAG: DNA ligase [Methanoregulaceae archaeon]|nr:DNA ligase [Methanoregulaceae archaeon]
MQKEKNKRAGLDEYDAKRDFSKTPEPRARTGGPGTGSRFVVQKHLARHLHYDLRLEVDGVLKSWAIPRGPSMDPHEKRLAVATEDHPVAYIDFEGVIPPGEYGAGAVMVWDYGTYRNMKEEEGLPVSVAEGIMNGHITVWLEGKRLQGGFALIRTPRGWLLIKMDDRLAQAGKDLLLTETVSALSGRTIEEIGKEGSPE